MGSNKREAARKIAFVYAFLGVIFFTLWTFTPTIRQYSFLEPLFYVFLPAILLTPYLIFDAIEEGLQSFRDRS
ncbi:MAG: hypothetical protein ACXAEB_13150 [Candidatus Thorarchaeota archaeon]